MYWRGNVFKDCEFPRVFGKRKEVKEIGFLDRSANINFRIYNYWYNYRMYINSYLSYVRKKKAKKLFVIGMILIGITLLIFAFFFYFGFIQGGLAPN